MVVVIISLLTVMTPITTRQPEMPAPDNLRARVQALIDEKKLSVNAAAAAIGIPQPTLAGILSGRTKEPRRPVVAQIAQHFGVDVEWIYEGKGRGIGDRLGDTWSSAALRWMDMVLGLKLPEPANSALHDLPMTTAQASTTMFLPRLAALTTPHEFPRATRKLREASTHEHEAWIAWLEEWMELAGRDVVRDAIIEHAERFRLRFAPYEFVPGKTSAEVLAEASATQRRSSKRR